MDLTWIIGAAVVVVAIVGSWIMAGIALRSRGNPRCSFCGRRWREAGPFVFGPKGYICERCIELATSMLQQEKRRAAASQSNPVDATDQTLSN